MSAETRGPLVAAATLLILALASLGVCVEVARPAEGEPATALRAGERAPYAGTIVPAETLRALLHAQDERDTLRAELAAEREARALDAEGAAVELQEARDVSDARERARAACEASRVPPRPERPWAGWPWVAAGLGAAAGATITVLAR